MKPEVYYRCRRNVLAEIAQLIAHRFPKHHCERRVRQEILHSLRLGYYHGKFMTHVPCQRYNI